MIRTSQVVLLSALLAASGVAQAAQGGEKKTVLTTFTILADMARNVAGDQLKVVSITKPGAEIHGYQPTPSDIVNARGADLILNNGLNLERWFEKFTGQLGGGKAIPTVILTEGITPISIASDAYKGKPNPHAWMSPKNALIYVENIRKAFVKLDPAGAKVFNTNAKKYSDQIRAVDAQLQSKLSALPRSERALVTCEGAFSYLARDYGLTEHYLWPVNAESSQGTPRQVKEVVDAVRNNKIPAVFCESTVPLNGMKQVAKEAGAKFGGVLYVDSLTDARGVVPTYLILLQKDADTILKGLTSK
ncbi:metal ABC transporter substrate-binding protein [Deinococcus marmoris]|uniref:metal ABC transporter substrate-binding protein n=1 Tax=Deinococcus marmoris TaxID=249408 RepID=UPI0009FB088D|nr:metal ABC transporter substrate-binding protein [Deinococcus marmoris]